MNWTLHSSYFLLLRSLQFLLSDIQEILIVDVFLTLILEHFHLWIIEKVPIAVLIAVGSDCFIELAFYKGTVEILVNEASFFFVFLHSVDDDTIEL